LRQARTALAEWLRHFGAISQAIGLFFGLMPAPAGGAIGFYQSATYSRYT